MSTQYFRYDVFFDWQERERRMVSIVAPSKKIAAKIWDRFVNRSSLVETFDYTTEDADDDASSLNLAIYPNGSASEKEWQSQ